MKRDALLAPLPVGKLPAWLLKKVLPANPSDPQVLVGPGIGCDAAAISVGDRVIIAKSDPITFASSGGEEHLVDVNANDVACMGATPRWLLVTALLPVGTTPADVLNEFAALREACRHRSIEIVGGHTEIVADLARPILVGMMLGESSPEDLIKPGTARPGDVLLLTKALAIEGTALLANERGDELRFLIGDAAVDQALRLLRVPGISVVREAELARGTGGVMALHDPTEGGLATAARELAGASGTGVSIRLDAIPILPETRAVADAFGLDPLGMLASGSLLIAARPEAVPAILRAVSGEGIAISAIGALTEDPDSFILSSNGETMLLPEFAVDEVARLFSFKSKIEGA